MRTAMSVQVTEISILWTTKKNSQCVMIARSLKNRHATVALWSLRTNGDYLLGATSPPPLPTPSSPTPTPSPTPPPPPLLFPPSQHSTSQNPTLHHQCGVSSRWRKEYRGKGRHYLLVLGLGVQVRLYRLLPLSLLGWLAEDERFTTQVQLLESVTSLPVIWLSTNRATSKTSVVFFLYCEQNMFA